MNHNISICYSKYLIPDTCESVITHRLRMTDLESVIEQYILNHGYKRLGLEIVLFELGRHNFPFTVFIQKQ